MGPYSWMGALISEMLNMPYLLLMLLLNEPHAQGVDGAVVHHGRITEHTVTEIIEALETHGFNNLVITSQGGREAEAMRLGRYLHRNNIKLTVRGYCLSSCGHYLIPATSIEIEDEALIGFHHSAYGLHYFSDRGDDQPSDFVVSLAGQTEEYFSYIERTDYLRSLVHAMVALGSQCFDDADIVYLRNDIWLPDPDYLDRLRIPTANANQGSPDRFRRELEAVLSGRLHVVTGVPWQVLEDYSNSQDSVLMNCRTLGYDT